MKKLFNTVKQVAYTNASLINKVGIIGVGLAMAAPASAATFSVSKILAGWKTEIGASMPVIMLLIAAVGMIMAGVSLTSAWSAKKNKQPLEWQGWGILVGAAVTIVPLIVMAFTGSLSGGNSSGESMINEMNLTY